MTLTTVHGMVMAKVASGELPLSDGNAALLKAMQEGAQAIRATEPEVAENRRILQEQERRELSEEALERLAEAAPVLEAITQGDLRSDMQEDILHLTQEMRLGPPRPPDGQAAPLGRDEAWRIFGRVSRMYLQVRRGGAEMADRIEASTGYRFADILNTLGGLLMLGVWIFNSL